MPGHYADNFIAYIIPLNSSVFHEVGITTPILQIGKLRFRVVKFLTPAHTGLTFLDLRCHVLWAPTLVRADP